MGYAQTLVCCSPVQASLVRSRRKPFRREQQLISIPDVAAEELTPLPDADKRSQLWSKGLVAFALIQPVDKRSQGRMQVDQSRNALANGPMI